MLSVQVREDGGQIAIGDQISIDCFDRRLQANPEADGTVYSPEYDLGIGADYAVKLPADFPLCAPSDRYTETRKATDHQATLRVVGFVAPSNRYGNDAAAYQAYTYIPNEPLPMKEEVAQGRRGAFLKLQLEQLETVSYQEQLGKICPLIDSVQFNTWVLTFHKVAPDNRVRQIIRWISLIILGFSTAASILLLYHMFSMSDRERRTYLGILSSVGATSSQRRSSVYFEAVVSCEAASAL